MQFRSLALCGRKRFMNWGKVSTDTKENDWAEVTDVMLYFNTTVPASRHQKLIPHFPQPQCPRIFLLLQDCIMYMHCFVCVCRSLIYQQEE